MTAKLEHLKRCLQNLEDRWQSTKNELRVARDWRVEAQIHFELIDLTFAHKRLLAQISSITASTGA